MKKITEILVNLISKLGITFVGIDKQIHFIVGFLISMVVFFITDSIMAGLFFTVFFAYVKEFKDEMDYGGFDWIDLSFTVGGGIVFALITLIWQ